MFDILENENFHSETTALELALEKDDWFLNEIDTMNEEKGWSLVIEY